MSDTTSNAWASGTLSGFTVSGVTASTTIEESAPNIVISQNGKELVNSEEFPEDINIKFHKGIAKEITLFGETIEKKSIVSIGVKNQVSWVSEESGDLSSVMINLKKKLSPAQEQVVANVIMQINL